MKPRTFAMPAQDASYAIRRNRVTVERARSRKAAELRAAELTRTTGIEHTYRKEKK